MPKKTTKPVAEKATTVAKEATTKKPTIKQLQEQYSAAILTIDNLEQVLATKNTLIDRLEFDILRVRGEAAEHVLKLETYTRSLEGRVNELENISWWQFTKDRLTQTFIRWFGGVG